MDRERASAARRHNSEDAAGQAEATTCGISDMLAGRDVEDREQARLDTVRRAAICASAEAEEAHASRLGELLSLHEFAGKLTREEAQRATLLQLAELLDADEHSGKKRALDAIDEVVLMAAHPPIEQQLCAAAMLSRLARTESLARRMLSRGALGPLFALWEGAGKVQSPLKAPAAIPLADAERAWGTLALSAAEHTHAGTASPRGLHGANGDSTVTAEEAAAGHGTRWNDYGTESRARGWSGDTMDWPSDSSKWPAEGMYHCEGLLLEQSLRAIAASYAAEAIAHLVVAAVDEAQLAALLREGCVEPLLAATAPEPGALYLKPVTSHRTDIDAPENITMEISDEESRATVTHRSNSSSIPSANSLAALPLHHCPSTSEDQRKTDVDTVDHITFLASPLSAAQPAPALLAGARVPQPINATNPSAACSSKALTNTSETDQTTGHRAARRRAAQLFLDRQSRSAARLAGAKALQALASQIDLPNCNDASIIAEALVLGWVAPSSDSKRISLPQLIYMVLAPDVSSVASTAIHRTVNMPSRGKLASAHTVSLDERILASSKLTSGQTNSSQGARRCRVVTPLLRLVQLMGSPCPSTVRASLATLSHLARRDELAPHLLAETDLLRGLAVASGLEDEATQKLAIHTLVHLADTPAERKTSQASTDPTGGCRIAFNMGNREQWHPTPGDRQDGAHTRSHIHSLDHRISSSRGSIDGIVQSARTTLGTDMVEENTLSTLPLASMTPTELDEACSPRKTYQDSLAASESTRGGLPPSHLQPLLDAFDQIPFERIASRSDEELQHASARLLSLLCRAQLPHASLAAALAPAATLLLGSPHALAAAAAAQACCHIALATAPQGISALLDAGAVGALAPLCAGLRFCDGDDASAHAAEALRLLARTNGGGNGRHFCIPNVIGALVPLAARLRERPRHASAALWSLCAACDHPSGPTMLASALREPGQLSAWVLAVGRGSASLRVAHTPAARLLCDLSLLCMQTATAEASPIERERTARASLDLDSRLDTQRKGGSRSGSQSRTSSPSSIRRGTADRTSARHSQPSAAQLLAMAMGSQPLPPSDDATHGMPPRQGGSDASLPTSSCVHDTSALATDSKLTPVQPPKPPSGSPRATSPLAVPPRDVDGLKQYVDDESTKLLISLAGAIGAILEATPTRQCDRSLRFPPISSSGLNTAMTNTGGSRIGSGFASPCTSSRVAPSPLPALASSPTSGEAIASAAPPPVPHPASPKERVGQAILATPDVPPVQHIRSPPPEDAPGFFLFANSAAAAGYAAAPTASPPATSATTVSVSSVVAPVVVTPPERHALDLTPSVAARPSDDAMLTAPSASRADATQMCSARNTPTHEEEDDWQACALTLCQAAWQVAHATASVCAIAAAQAADAAAAESVTERAMADQRDQPPNITMEASKIPAVVTSSASEVASDIQSRASPLLARLHVAANASAAASRARSKIVALIAVPLARLLECNEDSLEAAALRALAAYGFPRETHAVLRLMSREPGHLVDWWKANEALLVHVRPVESLSAERVGYGPRPSPPTEAALAALARQSSAANKPPNNHFFSAGGVAAAALALGTRGFTVPAGSTDLAGDEEVVICSPPPPRMTMQIETRKLLTFSWEQVLARLTEDHPQLCAIRFDGCAFGADFAASLGSLLASHTSITTLIFARPPAEKTLATVTSGIRGGSSGHLSTWPSSRLCTPTPRMLAAPASVASTRASSVGASVSSSVASAASRWADAYSPSGVLWGGGQASPASLASAMASGGLCHATGGGNTSAAESAHDLLPPRTPERVSATPNETSDDALAFLPVSLPPSVLALHVEAGALAPKAIRLMTAALHSATSLRTLSLSRSNLRPSDIAPLCTLFVPQGGGAPPGCALRHLSLRRNKLGDAGAKQLFEALCAGGRAGSCVLESLDLTSNQLTACTIEHLCVLLGSLPTLAALDLRRNDLSPNPANAAKAVAQAARTSPWGKKTLAAFNSLPSLFASFPATSAARSRAKDLLISVLTNPRITDLWIDPGLFEAKENSQLLTKLARNREAHQRYLDHAHAGAAVPEGLAHLRGGIADGGFGGGASGVVNASSGPGGVPQGGLGAGASQSGGLRSVLSFHRRTRSQSGHGGNGWAGTPPMIGVIFSNPLACTDASGKVLPMETLDIARERELICDSFAEARRAIRLRFEHATTDRLRTLVTLGTCVGLHYSGHGDPNYLSMEDGRGGAHFVQVDKLRRLLKAGGIASLRFVFVSACFSEAAAQAFVEVGVPHVIAVRRNVRVSDPAAHSFTRAFYLALAVGETVRDAYDIAKQAVVTAPSVPAGEREAANFLLLPRDAPHDKVVLPNLRPVDRWEPPAAPPGRLAAPLPAAPEAFLGRNVETYRVVSAILDRRLVSVVGPPGIGKSAVSLAALDYLAQRHYFSDGVLYIDISRATDAITLRDLFISRTPLLQRQRGPPSTNSAHWTATSGGSASPAPTSVGLNGGNLELDTSSDQLSLPASLAASGNASSRNSMTSSVGAAGGAESDFGADPLVAAVGPLLSLHCLLALDNVPTEVRGDASFHALLAALVSAPRVRTLLTAIAPVAQPLHGAAEKVIELTPLVPLNTARLLCRLSPRALLLNEIPGATNGADFVRKLATHPLIIALKGNPKAIKSAALKLIGPEGRHLSLGELHHAILASDSISSPNAGSLPSIPNTTASFEPGRGGDSYTTATCLAPHLEPKPAGARSQPSTPSPSQTTFAFPSSNDSNALRFHVQQELAPTLGACSPRPNEAEFPPPSVAPGKPICLPSLPPPLPRLTPVLPTPEPLSPGTIPSTRFLLPTDSAHSSRRPSISEASSAMSEGTPPVGAAPPKLEHQPSIILGEVESPLKNMAFECTNAKLAVDSNPESDGASRRAPPCTGPSPADLD